MLEQYKNELISFGAFDNKLPLSIEALTQTIANARMPKRMKTILAVSELTTFASQFRRNLWHWDGFELPVNSVSFLIAGSGTGKDSGVKAVRRSFASSYKIINKKRKELAKKVAIEKATEAGVEDPSSFEGYKEFYFEPAPIYIAPTTGPGLIQHLNDIADYPLGAGSIYAGEIGDELAISGNIYEIIKTISEIYDTGDKEMIYTKGKEYRSKAIISTPLSALFAGSPNYLIYDESVKNRFMIAFGSKLARRANFGYITELLPKTKGTTKERIEEERKLRNSANSMKETISKELEKITQYQIKKASTTITISEDVFYLFTLYKMYNEELAETIDPKFVLTVLVREHLQWKALKLAGALAIMRCNEEVTTEDYIEAINICELLNNDMNKFEIDLVKEPYEIFADYMKSIALNGKAKVSLHNLRKHKYITTTGKPDQKMKDLVRLAASYDKKAVYTITTDGIEYEEIKPTNTINISFKEVDNSRIYKCIENKSPKKELSKQKSIVAASASTGLIVEETTFAELGTMLHGDFAYSSFRFKDGIHLKENMLPGTKWLILDIDDSDITADEAHFILQDINHHIALSSNKDNEFKFRILIELDSVVDVDANTWRLFYQSIAEELSLKVDPLPQSTLFFSYSKSPVQSTIDASPIAVRDHLMYANEKAKEVNTVPKVLTTKQQQAAMADPFTTFSFAYDCPNDGTGSRKLLGAARKAYEEYGATKEETIKLIENINDYWVSSMDEARLKNTLISQILRWN